MEIIRYAAGGTARIGCVKDGRVFKIAVPTLADLLQYRVEDLEGLLNQSLEPEPEPTRLLPPIDGLTEVWASGVTYERSSDARQEESATADVYSTVYDAERPELFFKAPAWRVVGHLEPIGVRQDSPVNVPEPELALVVNRHQQIVGATICDDVSSRSIEGENPLYLPQAKVYSGSCALGPGWHPIWDIDHLLDLRITVRVQRVGEVVWADETSSSLIHRSLETLVDFLFRQAHFPAGAILSTGTGLVPSLDFTLQAGDTVEVGIEGLGQLVNTVRLASDANFGWLTPEPAREPR